MISTIVVVGKNREIGCQNKLLWQLPLDMQRFKKITEGKTVLMGEKTFLSIGKPLKNRKNIVVTLDKKFFAEGVEIRNDLEEVLREYKNKEEELFVIGGGQIYSLSLSWADRLYLTVINDAPLADVFFPDYSVFNKVIQKETGVDNGLQFEFLILEKENNK